MIEIIIAIIFILFPSIVLHECAHGWVAYRLGDPTAKQAGRLTLNPLKHVDLVGTIILPAAILALRLMGQNILLIGWAKPVPVNFARLRHPKRDMIWVALAGPASNILLAIIFSCALRLPVSSLIQGFVEGAVFINVLLAVFNMIPIPPLDGSRVVTGLLPRMYGLVYNKVERYGILIIFGLFYLGLFDRIILPIIYSLCSLLGVRI